MRIISSSMCVLVFCLAGSTGFSATKPPVETKPEDKLTSETTIQLKYLEVLSKLDFVLPDGQLSTKLGWKKETTSLILSSFYDFPLGEIKAQAKLQTGLGKWKIGLTGTYKVNFEKVLQQEKYISRVRSGGVDFERSLGNNYALDLGITRQEDLWIELDETDDDEDTNQKQNKLSLSLDKEERDNADNPTKGYHYRLTTTQSIRQFKGDYEYNKVDADSELEFKLPGIQTTTTVRGGTPVYKFLYPSFENFTLGGWDSLRGYPTSHFDGEKMVVGREEWNIPLFSMSGKWWIFAPKSLGLLASVDAGRAGDEDRKFFIANEYTLSAAAGLWVKWSFRDRIPIYMLFAWGKGLEHRKGVFYFRYRIK